MMAVKELYDMKPASVDIKMYFAFFKVRSDCLPDPDLGMKLFCLTPRGISDAPAVYTRGHKQYFKLAPVPFCSEDKTADLLTVTDNAVGFAAVY